MSFGSYCDADNLVDPVLMAGFGDRDVQDVGDLRRYLEAHAHQLSRTGAWASVSVLVLVLVAPLGAIVWMFVASVGLRWLELPADTSIRYGLEDFCFVEHTGDIGVESLPGRYQQYRFACDVAVVEKVYRDPIFDTNYVRARAGDELRRGPVQGLCLAGHDSMWLAHDQTCQQNWLHFDGDWVWFLVGDRKTGGGALRRVSIDGGDVQELLRVGEHPLDAATDGVGGVWVATHLAVYTTGVAHGHELLGTPVPRRSGCPASRRPRSAPLAPRGPAWSPVSPPRCHRPAAPRAGWPRWGARASGLGWRCPRP